MVGRPINDEIPPSPRKKILRRVLENLRQSIYYRQACNGILRGDPVYSGPQIFPLAKDALYFQCILRAAKAFDHHPRAASFFKLQMLRQDIVVEVGVARNFDLSRLEPFAMKLRQIRNRALAHDDIGDLSMDRDVWQEQALLGGELAACIEFAFAALNEMLNREFGETVHLLNYDGGDAEELARIANQMNLASKWSNRLF